jgi:NAD kinase
VLIAVGGDGTFLAAARAAAGCNIPLIGVNLGRLGFLVDISPAELLTKLGDILQGKHLKPKLQYTLQNIRCQYAEGIISSFFIVTAY